MDFTSLSVTGIVMIYIV